MGVAAWQGCRGRVIEVTDGAGTAIGGPEGIGPVQ
jgi:hypothetical protein